MKKITDKDKLESIFESIIIIVIVTFIILLGHSLMNQVSYKIHGTEETQSVKKDFKDKNQLDKDVVSLDDEYVEDSLSFENVKSTIMFTTLKIYGIFSVTVFVVYILIFATQRNSEEEWETIEDGK